MATFPEFPEFPEFNDAQLTTTVLESFASAPDPRVRTVLHQLISHLHAFVRDVDLTFDEWRAAIDFLTRTGHASSATRQEFILLSDVLGVSMLVDARNHSGRAGATETTVLGPFYVGEHRVAPHGTDLSPGSPGERVFVDASVTDVTGRPIAGAMIDVWHAGSDGLYDSQRPGYRLDEPAMRARFISGDDGRFFFRTSVPRSYPVPTDGPVGELLRASDRHAMRPAHIHFLLAAPGFETLVTHVFVAGDRYLDSDAVFGVKPSLVARLEPHDEPSWPDGTPAPARWHRLSYRFALTSTSNKEPTP
ncbi:MAG TPA: dioxygenase [Kofleriaceae bacterium]|jgi:protocatechuate 3,4-dioxygenase beta subunit|nr:dioxygenase [Kofleriaceae bacterium]